MDRAPTPGSTALRKPVRLSDHCRHVEGAIKTVLDHLSMWAIAPDIRKALEVAALYHDAGKAHPAFQRMMLALSKTRSCLRMQRCWRRATRAPETNDGTSATSWAAPWPSWSMRTASMR